MPSHVEKKRTNSLCVEAWGSMIVTLWGNLQRKLRTAEAGRASSSNGSDLHMDLAANFEDAVRGQVEEETCGDGVA